MPAGQGLLGPIDAALRTTKHWLMIQSNKALCSALSDFGILLHIIASRPSHCQEFIADSPGYIDFCDASSYGAGGIWFSGTKALHPVIWHIPWPLKIHTAIVSFQNPSGSISNSDLEMAGMLLHYIFLEHIVPLWHVHIAASCDNTLTVS